MLFVFCFNFFSYLILFITFQTNEHISTAPGRELFPPFTISAMEGELEIFFLPQTLLNTNSLIVMIAIHKLMPILQIKP